MNSGIYIARSHLTGHIKIGHSTDIDRRLATLRTGHPGGLELVHKLDCSDRVERWLHRNLKVHRVPGGGREWYEAKVLQDRVLSALIEQEGV